MPSNIDPIYSREADIQWISIASAAAGNTAVDGTGTVYTVWTADATNGGFLQSVRIKAASTSVQTVMRFFINNGGTNATATNNSFIEEYTLPIITASSTAANPSFEVPISRAFPPGYKLNVVLATSVTGAVYITGFGGKY